MKQDRIYITGYNPTLESFLGTSNENVFRTGTDDSNSLISLLKNEQVIVEDEIIYIPCESI